MKAEILKPPKVDIKKKKKKKILRTQWQNQWI